MKIFIALIGIAIIGTLFFRFCYDFYEVWARPIDYLNRTNAWKTRLPWLFKNYRPLEPDQLRWWGYLAIWTMRLILPFIILLITGVVFAFLMSLSMIE